MHIAVTLRNMGPQSDRETLRDGARYAEELGFESVWVTDHIAIPPDDAEGSGGRYTDPLTTLAWLGGLTQRIKLGVGVLIAPYRPPLPTAKAVATLHELTKERLLLGLAVGWMDPEFRALGVPRNERGVRTDELLRFLQHSFTDDVVQSNGQNFLFEPKPPLPPIYLGGSAKHALKRCVRFGCGWLPMSANPDKLAHDIEHFSELAQAANAARGPVTVMSNLPLEDAGKASALLHRFRELGVDRFVCGHRYNTLSEYKTRLEMLARLSKSQ